MTSLSQSRYVSDDLSRQKNMSNMNRIQGIIYMQRRQDENSKKNQLIQVKSDSKLVLNSYKRYKTFSFSFDYIYISNESNSFYHTTFNQFNAIQAIQQGFDYMLFCTGLTLQSERQLPKIQTLFYEQLAALHETLVKKQQFKLAFNIIATGQQSCIDLISGKVVEIREASSAIFVDTQKAFPQTPYQIIELIKKTLKFKQKVCLNSYFVIYVEAINPQNKLKKQRILLINGAKDKEGFAKAWDNKINLVLNKCILALISKNENNKQIYAPFRDSKITRIIKPFFKSYSKIDVIGFLDPTQEDISYNTLNLVKNLSRIKIKSENFLQNPQYSPPVQKINQKLTLSNVKQKHKTQNSGGISKKQSISDINFVNIRQNFIEQIKAKKKVQQIRAQITLVKKRKELAGLKLLSEEQLQLSQRLQNEQIQYDIQKQQQLLQKIDNLNKDRVQSIQKSTSITQKLKLMKQYYTLAINCQKQEIQQFTKNQIRVGKFYQQKLQQINKQLKKSPKELLTPVKKSLVVNTQQIYKKQDTKEQINLPKISKRLLLIKKKVKKGRVQYQSFLNRNVSQYQSYKASSD